MVAAVVVAAGASAGVAPAAAASLACASTAKVVAVHDLTADHSGHLLSYGADAPSGARFTGATLRRAHFYELHGVSATVVFGKTTYRLDRNAIVMLSCSGTAAGTAAKYPSLRMLRGRARVSDPRSWYGSVTDEEGLYNPVPGDGRAMTFTITRTLRQTAPLSLLQRLKWYANTADQPLGTTTTATSGSPKLNVTPFVGSRPGSCRHCAAAKLTSTAYGKGSAAYR